MRLTPTDRDAYRLIATALITTVVVIGSIIAVFSGQRAANGIKNQLRERSQTMAAGLGASLVTTLQGTAADDDTPAYNELKLQLADIKTANTGTRSTYLMGERNGRLFFYVDSEAPGSDDYSPPGEYYDDATPALKAVFTNGNVLVEGPVRDNFGTFISGLAPIFKPGTNQVVAIIGMDVEATTYWRDVLFAASLPGVTSLSLVLIIGVFEWIRRRNLQLLELRSELVSVASHELRTPITGIRWAAESLEKMNTDPTQSRLIRAIHSSAQNLQASTDDILELSHAVNNRQLNLAPTNLSALMEEVINTQLLSAEQKGVVIQRDTSWPAELIVRCDTDKFKRVLHNVLSNAIKYTGDHTTITIAYKTDDRFHHLLVSDQGIGIPEAEQAKVFHGFYRASNAKATNIPGTGLGLYLVKTVLAQHGGKVTFVSHEGKGTVFDLRLPKV